MTSPLRISLIGLGRAGRFHLQSLQLLDGTRLQTVFDVDQQRAAEVAQAHGCQAAPDAEAALGSPDVDAVIVASPTNVHFEYVTAALEAGKPVLTEKPLGTDLDQIDQCFDLARRQRQPLFVAFQRRFDPSFASLVQAVHDGQIGDLQFVRSASRDNPVPSPDYIRISGGIFHDCMVHDLDMVCQIVGQPPTHVSAFASSFIDSIGKADDFDNVAATLSFSNGVVATIDVNRKSVYGYDQRIEAFGDGGMLQADNQHQNTVTKATVDGFRRSPVDYSFPTRYREAYLAELKCFVACARGQQAVPITHQQVRDNFLLATALEIAARECRVVTLDEMRER